MPALGISAWPCTCWPAKECDSQTLSVASDCAAMPSHPGCIGCALAAVACPGTTDINIEQACAATAAWANARLHITTAATHRRRRRTVKLPNDAEIIPELP